MKKVSTKVTASEREVLELLWNQKEALTSAEIVQLSEGKRWKPSYIHLMITSLLKKNLIEIATFKQTTKNYARAFAPTMTREEFSIRMLKEENHLNTQSLSLLFGTLLEEEADRDLINTLSDMLEKKKKELDSQEES